MIDYYNVTLCGIIFKIIIIISNKGGNIFISENIEGYFVDDT